METFREDRENSGFKNEIIHPETDSDNLANEEKRLTPEEIAIKMAEEKAEIARLEFTNSMSITAAEETAGIRKKLNFNFN